MTRAPAPAAGSLVLAVDVPSGVDGLTGVANRRSLMQRLALENIWPKRGGERQDAAAAEIGAHRAGPRTLWGAFPRGAG